MQPGRDGDPGRLTAAPDVPAAVAGWRCWQITDHGEPRLGSPVFSGEWPPGRAMVAQCRTRGEHAVPAPGCRCGLYALRELPLGYADGADLLGCVALWGRVVEGEHGWRAERGYPVALFAAPHVGPDQRRRIADSYRVPVYALPQPIGVLLGAGDAGLSGCAEELREAASHPEPGDLDARAEAFLAEADRIVPLAVDLGRYRRQSSWRTDLRTAVEDVRDLLVDASVCLLACLLVAAPVVGIVALLFWLSGAFDPDPVPVPLFSVTRAADPPTGTCIATRPDWDAKKVTTDDACAAPHWGEVLGYPALGAVPSPYPGADRTAATGSFECGWLLAARGLSTADYQVTYALPDEPSWNRGSGGYENYTTCAVLTRSGAPLPAGRLVDPAAPLRDDVTVPMNLFDWTAASDAPTGACVGPGPSPYDTASVPIVRCDRPHRAEVLGYPALYTPGAPWPGDAAVYTAAQTACGRTAAARPPPAGYAVSIVWPNSMWFRRGPDPVYATCLLVRADGGAWAGSPR